MNDLVTRLRGPIKHPQENVTQRQEAADMIESMVYLLNECATHLEDTADADYDGERWQPNDSMKLVEMIDELVGKPE